jgi:N-acetylglucosamine-6-phosphate deacetylase
MQNEIILSGATVHTEKEILTNATLLIANQKIAAINSRLIEVNPATKTIKLPPTWHVIPGFIDLHIHGAYGVDTMDASIEALATMSKKLPAEGVTSFLPATMTAPEDRISKALQCVCIYQKNPTVVGAEILGIYLEGPFLAKEKAGAQKPEEILVPDLKLCEEWQEQSGNLIKIIAIAPEVPNALDFIKHFHKQGIILSFAHSNADYAVGCAAIKAGVSHVTHCFNAMRDLDHQKANAAAALLLDDNVNIELIADGIHIHPAILTMSLKIKGADKITLITDSIRAKGLGDGESELGGQKVIIKNGSARLVDGTLAGSVLSMDQVLRNIIKFTQCTLGDAIKMTSTNQARLLKIFDHKGSIAVGKDADIVVLDEKYQIMLTIGRGQILHQHPTFAQR